MSDISANRQVISEADCFAEWERRSVIERRDTVYAESIQRASRRV